MSKFSGPYRDAAELLNPLLSKQKGNKSLKSLAFGKRSNSNSNVSKSAYATVCKTLENKRFIDEILSYSVSSSSNGNQKKTSHGSLRSSIFFDKEKNTNGIKDHGLAYILLYELLFGKYNKIRGGGKAKRVIMSYKDNLLEAQRTIMSSHEGDEGYFKKINPFPRYARVNSLRIKNINATIGELKEEFPTFYADPHVPNLLVFPPGTDLHAHKLVKEGGLVLQDKSSCFSALALASESLKSNSCTGDMLDACAAPGNKTTHLACLCSQNDHNIDALKASDRKVYALDRDSRRIKILKSRIELLAPSSDASVEPIHADFLALDQSDKRFKNLRGILLDPSCSGSGIVNQPDRIDNDEDSAKRLKALSNFQITALKHAMSFAQVETIVYSTCSVNDEENEHVIATCLKENENSEWTLVSPQLLEDWPRRGKVVGGLLSEQAKCLIRCDARQGDPTNGFFVACLKRKSHVSTDLKTASSHLILRIPTGLQLYSGQFRQEKDSSYECVNSMDINSTLLNKMKDQEDTAPNTKNKKIIPTKKSKKLKWKQKQAAQKNERLKKKEQSKLKSTAKINEENDT